MKFKRFTSAVLCAFMCATIFSSNAYAAENDAIFDNNINTASTYSMDSIEIINAKTYDAPVVILDSSLNSESRMIMTYSLRSVDMPCTGGIYFGGSTTYAYTPIMNVSFSDNGEGIKITLDNVSPYDLFGKNVHIKVYSHYEGESDNIYHESVDSDYVFKNKTSKLINFGTVATSIDKLYIEFSTDGSSDFYTSFDYKIEQTRIFNV